MGVDVALSAQIASLIGALPQQCYGNAYRSVFTPSPLTDGYYVEGWVTDIQTGRRVAHAWVEREGSIIDPTLYMAALIYEPIRRWTADEAFKALTACGHLPLGP